MRRRWGLSSFLCVSLASWTAAAQEADTPTPAEPAAGESTAPPQAITYGAMPGGLHAPTAETLAKGAAQVSTLAGLGRRTGLLGPDHKFNRGIGDIAAAYGITDTISAGLTLDGRYDRHWGIAPSGDDGYVGDPKLIFRVAQPGSVSFGGQIGIWIPGKNAPSVAASAISVDARVLVSLPAGPGLLSFSGGFRLDNSAKSVDDPLRLSLQDRVSLGVSDYHALLGAAQLRLPVGEMAWVAVEGSLDNFIGGPPDAKMGEVKRAELRRSKMLLRGAITAGVHFNNSFSGVVFVEAAKDPGVNLAQVMDNNIPLVPYEPIITGGIGIEARFGGPKAPPKLYDVKDCAKHNPPDCPAVKVPLLTEVSGTVVDTAGKPVVGAKVTLTLKSSQVAPVVTDDKGAFVFKGVPIGSTIEGKSTVEETGVEVNVDLGGMKPGKATIAQVAEGSNTVPPITLEPVLPPGQLRGVVRTLKGGKPIKNASVSIEPGGKKIETDDEGTFSIDLAPGQYKITVTAPNLKTQELDVTIDPNGVAIKNIDLQ